MVTAVQHRDDGPVCTRVTGYTPTHEHPQTEGRNLHLRPTVYKTQTDGSYTPTYVNKPQSCVGFASVLPTAIAKAISSGPGDT